MSDKGVGIVGAGGSFSDMAPACRGNQGCSDVAGTARAVSHDGPSPAHFMIVVLSIGLRNRTVTRITSLLGAICWRARRHFHHGEQYRIAPMAAPDRPRFPDLDDRHGAAPPGRSALSPDQTVRFAPV